MEPIPPLKEVQILFSIKQLYLLILLCASVSSCQGQNQKLVWSEEFNGQELNQDIWNFELGDGCPKLCGWGNNERQIYTTTNHRFEDGKLIIRANKEEDRYTATRITTQGKKSFQYGRIEARVKLPQGEGLWPAFWLLGNNITEVGWPRCGEIDVMEYVGKKPGEIFTSLHTQSSFGNTINTETKYIEGIEEGYHIFEVDWQETQISFAVDGTKVYTYQPEVYNEETWPFNQPFFLLLNLAIGGNFGGPNVDDTIFPQDYYIDYIRVYQ